MARIRGWLQSRDRGTLWVRSGCRPPNWRALWRMIYLMTHFRGWLQAGSLALMLGPAAPVFGKGRQAQTQTPPQTPPTPATTTPGGRSGRGGVAGPGPAGGAGEHTADI